MCDSDRSDHNLMVGLLLGAIMGGGLVWYLTSTEEGRKIRRKLEEKGVDAFGNLSDIVEDLEEKSGELKQQAQKVQVELEGKVESVKEGVAQKTKKEITKIEKLKDRGQKIVNRFFTHNGKPLN